MSASQGTGVSGSEAGKLRNRLHQEAESAGYHLNPDREFTLGLMEGLLVNEQRYGYWACPCRLASGVKSEDLDIICPCDYRDPDLAEHGACYCGLYVSSEVFEGRKSLKKVPERRAQERREAKSARSLGNGPEERGARLQDRGALPYPVWRCGVCGYLCARGEPPETCPICKAKKDRFERFL
jgi:ferredoxin-thioredoxin reductase catalytic subunit